jgi:hypothetical protein
LPYQWGASLNDALLKSLKPGLYKLLAVALDQGGRQGRDSITVTVLDDIIGPDCGVRNGTAIYEVNPKYLKDVKKISWWFNGYTKSIRSLAPDNSKVEVSFGPYFNPGDLHVGINYKKAPYYLEFRKDLVLCGSTSARVVSETSALIMSPNPTSGAFAITAGKEILEASVFNSSGLKVFESAAIRSVDFAVKLDAKLPTGIYKVLIKFTDGSLETKTLSLQR